MTYTSNSLGLQLESAAFGDGVIRVTGTSQETNYFLTDHLGSVRVIVDKNGAVKERNDYYAFGAKHIRGDYPQSDNRYDYNGKEEQTTGYLKFLDYGARMYDGALGRWFNVDPLAEEYSSTSPYTYVSNNPIYYIDPNGMFETKFGASWYKFWNGGDVYRDSNSGEFFVSKLTNFDVEGGGGIKSSRIFGWDGRNMGKDFALEAKIDEYIFMVRMQEKYREMGSELTYAYSRLEAIANQMTFAMPSALKLGTSIVNSVQKTEVVTNTALVTKYPANPAVSGSIENTYLMPGQVIDRYGSLGGRWFSAPGTSYAARSLPPNLSPYTQFRVLKPFHVKKSIASPGMLNEQTGFGIQFYSPVSVQTLINKRIITPLKP